jgi:hypothetical protein
MHIKPKQYEELQRTPTQIIIPVGYNFQDNIRRSNLYINKSFVYFEERYLFRTVKYKQLQTSTGMLPLNLDLSDLSVPFPQNPSYRIEGCHRFLTADSGRHDAGAE